MEVIPPARLVRKGRSDLATVLRSWTADAELFVTEEGGAIRCTACAHRCVLAEDGRVGACGVRYREEGRLHAPHGYVARRYVRAVETNTVYHVEPGAKALTFGMYGCDLRCPYCHNWRLSQALREDVAAEAPTPIDARALVEQAAAEGCRVVCAAYNEPMIAAEWVRDVFTEAQARGLRTVIVSDGHTTPEALALLRPVTDCYRVDLKGPPGIYKTLGGRYEPVLEAIREARRLGYWVEVVTLVVPGMNDDPGVLRTIATTLAAIDPDIPWHLNAFQPRYRMRDRPPPAPEALVMAAGVAYVRGLRFVYVGNVTRAIAELEHTRCPSCREVVIERRGYETVANRLRKGSCPGCGERIPGVFG